MFGRIVLWTDYKPLVSMSEKPLVSAPKLCYRPGKDMVLANTLSSAYLDKYERSDPKVEVKCSHPTSFLFQSLAQKTPERQLVTQPYKLWRKLSWMVSLIQWENYQQPSIPTLTSGMSSHCMKASSWRGCNMLYHERWAQKSRGSYTSHILESKGV